MMLTKPTVTTMIMMTTAPSVAAMAMVPMTATEDQCSRLPYDAHHSYNQHGSPDAQDDRNTQCDHRATTITTLRVPTMTMVPLESMISKVAKMITVPAMKMVPWCS